MVPVEELTNEHSFGEYKEILRPLNKVRAALKKYPNKLLFMKHYKKMPDDYVLGTGHETFFFNKLMYIADRYMQLCEWRKARGYKYTELTIEDLIGGLPSFVLNNYVPTENALQLNRMRINDRLNKETQND
ncbi:hypothetical protein [Alishewanella phage vB_AspM_Slicko01]|nr:hypothetical protein [Alishewanella phage vB_AspM_Slicko01]